MGKFNLRKFKLRRFKLPTSFPRLSFAAGGFSWQQAWGPVVASAGIIGVLLLFLTGGLDLQTERDSQTLIMAESLKTAKPQADSPERETVVTVKDEEFHSNASPNRIIRRVDRPQEMTKGVGTSIPSAASRNSLQRTGKTSDDTALVFSASSRHGYSQMAERAGPKSGSTDLMLGSTGPSLRLLSLRLSSVASDHEVAAPWLEEWLSYLDAFDVVVVQGLPFRWESSLRRHLMESSSGDQQWDLISCDPELAWLGGTHVAFLWKPSQVRCSKEQAYLVQDPKHRFSQPPMVASFESRIRPGVGSEPFGFSVVHVVHQGTSSHLEGETDTVGFALRDVYLRVRRYEFESRGEEDCILMGQWPGKSFPRTFSSARNLTQSERSLSQELANHLIDLSEDVSPTKVPMHLVMDRRYTRELTGRCVPLNQTQERQSEADLVCRDLLSIGFDSAVWGEFAALEQPPYESVANGDSTTMRR
ncbi:MAG: hypothetical protein VX694_17485 [Planctomycetota bacterium]|nr:hypothetical protein [Planctomycetota bacterium]